MPDRIERMLHPFFILLVAAGLAWPCGAESQDVPAVPSSPPAAETDFLPADSLAAGMRVRLTAPGIALRRTGTLTALIGDTLLFRGERFGELVRVPFDHVESLQVSRGRGRTRSRIISSAAVGFVAGLGLAGLIQIAADSEGRTCTGSLRRRNCSIDPGVLLTGILFGSTTGALFGAATPGEYWRAVRLR